ncbi:short-chain fatty acid transporter [Desertibacillus haloalkaliphilus]|uniref:short-chain fatty acid transporter n=1 Tax=Desertibacillus haloalkaliphilus TaxID=1328930 RepID=UPI001C26BDCC|nr:TIGR00366 family protein [Desertibacillus haloalkaliphilus]MBU8908927.1 TIGR00366 family protein [Desertibacillus haloalkaliphilus]
MLRVLSEFFTRIMQRYLPDAILFAILLSFITYFLGIFIGGANPISLLGSWGTGLWDLLEFSMQVTLTLVTSYILAHTRPVQKVLETAASKVKTPTMAITICVIISMIASMISWGFGLIIGALVAKEIAKQVRGVHYPLLVASAYSGFVIWHGGLSSSVGLAIATPGHFMEEQIGVIPVSQTVFSSYNLITLAVVFVTLPIILNMMKPKKEHVMEFTADEQAATAELEPNNEPPKQVGDTPAQRWENSRVSSLLLGGFLLTSLILYLVQNGGLDAINLNIVNLFFICFGMLFVSSPKEYVGLGVDAGKSAANIIIQYPLYSGIMAMMTVSGLAAMISDGFVSISTEQTLPIFSFLAAGVVNMFVPSGGGQWAIQAPIMLPAAQELGVDIAKVAMAVAWGDAWTNMLQPFWALPMLAIAKLSIRDVMGYCCITLIWVGIVFTAVFLIF